MDNTMGFGWKDALNIASPVTGFIPGLRGGVAQGIGDTLFGDGGAAEMERKRREQLEAQAAQAAAFAGRTQGNYKDLTQRGTGALNTLQAQAEGRGPSIVGEQLRQGLQQGLAAQRSLAASAPIGSSAMAARNAAIQAGQMSAGMSGQAALARMQEQQAAQQQYAALLQGLRGQDLQGALGSRQTAVGAYSPANAGQPEKSFLEKYGPMIMAGASLVSDKRLKTDARKSDDAANRAIDGATSYTYRYRDPKHGAGKQLGTTAQDLERSGLAHAVMNTPIGKVVHAGKLAGAHHAMIGALGRRLAKLEGDR